MILLSPEPPRPPSVQPFVRAYPRDGRSRWSRGREVTFRVTSLRQRAQMAATGRHQPQRRTQAKRKNQKGLATSRERRQLIAKETPRLSASQPLS
jgi:hypothetical protein